jgi:hypothetical protein
MVTMLQQNALLRRTVAFALEIQPLFSSSYHELENPLVIIPTRARHQAKLSFPFESV